MSPNVRVVSLTIVAVSLVLAGCSANSSVSTVTPPVSGLSALSQAPPTGPVRTIVSRIRTGSSSEKVLHSFGASGTDGTFPYAALINFKGTLYGTTAFGGSNQGGTVYSITPSGTETVLYRFGGSGDGITPFAALVNVKGTFYGTTYSGAVGGGTVFSMTPSGTETVLYRFVGFNGADPVGSLIDVKGKLYGTTAAGGVGSGECYGGACGTVFSITRSGTLKTLHSFTGYDGRTPTANLVNVKGTLYSTTYRGGAHGAGTVFSITRSGTETVLHSFGGSGDGTNPNAGLINVKGTLYGTTEAGGANGHGTVFSVTPSGTETVLHSFAGSTYGPDGAYPEAGLINVKGTLYGTTLEGGARGDGTVFSITPSGTETVLYSFAGSTYGPDGAYPEAGLINVKGTLYGTTSVGGSGSCQGGGTSIPSGCGTVFSLKP